MNFKDSLKKIDLVSIGVAVVGVAGAVLGAVQKKNETKMMEETIAKKVEEKIQNLK